MSFRHIDTAQADGTFVSFSMVKKIDEYELAHEHIRYVDWAAGDIDMLGIQARADILIVRKGHGTMYSLTSPGCWGVESDSDAACIAQIYADEVEQLRCDLAAIGAYIERAKEG